METDMAYMSDISIPSYSPLGLGAGIATVKRWAVVSKERRVLRTMTMTQLDDLGLTVDDARREAGRPFWASARR
jgi:uncharacterized protein YjiS (DUF1127 family)